MIRADFIFSHWLFLWYLLYIFGFATDFNPKFALIVAFITNIVRCCFMILVNTDKTVIFLFVMAMSIIKIIPLITIWNTKITLIDIIFTFQLFFIYFIWVFLSKYYSTKNTNDNNKAIRIIYEIIAIFLMVEKVDYFKIDIGDKNKVIAPLMLLIAQVLHIKVKV